MATNPWALPTTGNLAFDDYRRAQNAWMRAHPYQGSETYDSRGVQDLVGGGIDSLSGINADRNAWEKKQLEAFGATLTPEQQAELARLGSDRNAKLRRNGQLAALGAFGTVAGLGALGAGMLGGGAAAGAESLAAADIAGGLVPEFGSEAAYMSSLGAVATPLGESALPVMTDLGAAGGGAMPAMGEYAVPGAVAGTGGGGGGAAAVPGLDSYYTGLGGVDGSLVGSGVSNTTGYGGWLKNLSPDLLKSFSNLLGGSDSLVKGLYALYQSKRFTDLGKGTPSQQTANAQLNTLLQDPNQIYKMPGWEAGLQAVQRTGAGQGYLGSGNMMVALNKYGGDFYNNTVRQLNDIATGGQNVQAAYTTAGADLFGQGTNSIGYWLSKYGSPVFDMISGKP